MKPESDPQALFRQAGNLLAQGRSDEARDLFSLVLGRCRPPDLLAAKASFQLWLIAHRLGDQIAADREATYLRRHFADSLWVDKLNALTTIEAKPPRQTSPQEVPPPPVPPPQAPPPAASSSPSKPADQEPDWFCQTCWAPISAPPNPDGRSGFRCPHCDGLNWYMSPPRPPRPSGQPCPVCGSPDTLNYYLFIDNYFRPNGVEVDKRQNYYHCRQCSAFFLRDDQDQGTIETIPLPWSTGNLSEKHRACLAFHLKTGYTPVEGISVDGVYKPGNRDW